VFRSDLFSDSAAVRPTSYDNAFWSTPHPSRPAYVAT
jgi:hypothetical protein